MLTLHVKSAPAKGIQVQEGPGLRFRPGLLSYLPAADSAIVPGWSRVGRMQNLVGVREFEIAEREGWSFLLVTL